jgi:hypothetical protein
VAGVVPERTNSVKARMPARRRQFPGEMESLASDAEWEKYVTEKFGEECFGRAVGGPVGFPIL